MKLSIKRRLALFMAMILLLLTVPTLAVSAANENVQLIAANGSVAGTYGTISAAHTAAISKKLDFYTIKLLNDVVLDGSQLKLVNKLPTTWKLDGNGKSITQPSKGEIALYITGNSGTTMYFEDLTVISQGTGVLCEAGTFNFVSGTYKMTNPSVWVNAAIECRPVEEYKATVNIMSGSYIGEITVGGNDEGKLQAVVRLFTSSPLAKATMNIYGGYFLVTSDNAPYFSDNVIYAGSTAKVSTLNIYGGTFESVNTKYVLTNDNKNLTNIYGGNFVGSVVWGDGSVADQAVINNNQTGAMLFVYAANMIGGGSMIGNRAAANPEECNIQGWYYYSGSPSANGERRGTFSEKEAGSFKEYTPKIITGASLKLGDTAGIRFTSTVSSNAIANISAYADEGTKLSYGMVITGADLAGVRYNTADTLAAKGIAYVDIKAENPIETSSGGVRFGAGISGIKAEHYGTKFNSIPYVEAIIDGQSVRFYALYDGLEHSRSVSDLAKAAIADVKNVQDTEYVNAVGNGSYSPYTAAQIASFNSYIVG